MTTTYSPDGRGHRALERVSNGPATIGEIREWFGPLTANQQRKSWYLMGSLLSDGLLTCRGGIYVITTAGMNALAQLRSGQPVITGAAPDQAAAA